MAEQGQESVGQGDATMGKKDFCDEVADNIGGYISQEHAVDQGKISKFAVCADVGFHGVTIDQSCGFVKERLTRDKTVKDRGKAGLSGCPARSMKKAT